MKSTSIRRRPFLRMTGLVGLATAAGGITSAAEIAPELHIEGYAGEVSYPQGAELTLHVSSSQRRYSVEITRVGAQRTVVWKGTAETGAIQPIPANASSHGCGWPVGLRVPIAANWKSGYYQVQFRVELLLHRASGATGRGFEDPPAVFHQHLQRLQQLGRF